MNSKSVAIKGLMLTPPLLGRISIGHIETNGKGQRVPVRDNHFTITAQAKRQGEWITHPLHNELLKSHGKKDEAREEANAKLTAIPVKLMFDDPSLNMRAEFTAFHRDGRPMCVGDGDQARRVNRAEGKVEPVQCIPGSCEFGKENCCKVYGRLNVQIEGQDDELGTFIFRTTGFNSIRSIATRMEYLRGISGGNLAGMPLTLLLRGKSTSQSHGSPVFYVDLTVREGMKLSEAVKVAREFHADWESAGLERESFEESARQGMLNGLFEDTPEETEYVLEEFFNEYVENNQKTPAVLDVSNVAGSLEQLRETLDSVTMATQQESVGSEDPEDVANPVSVPAQHDLLETVAAG